MPPVASAVPQTPHVPVLQEQGLQLCIPQLLVQLSPGTGLSLLPCQNHLCNTGVSEEGARESKGYQASLLCPTASAAHQCSPSNMLEGPFLRKNDWEAGGRGGKTRAHRGWTLVKWLYRLTINLERHGSQQSIPWLGRSDSKHLPSHHVQETWQTLFPILSPEVPSGIC